MTVGRKAESCFLVSPVGLPLLRTLLSNFTRTVSPTTTTIISTRQPVYHDFIITGRRKPTRSPIGLNYWDLASVGSKVDRAKDGANARPSAAAPEHNVVSLEPFLLS